MSRFFYSILLALILFFYIPFYRVCAARQCPATKRIAGVHRPGRTLVTRDFSSVIRNALASVVTVRVEGAQLDNEDLSMLSDEALYDLFLSSDYRSPQRKKVMFRGTGFVVRAMNNRNKQVCVIVTNHHVVSSAVDGNGSIHVTFQTGDTVRAKIVAVDPLTDLAVLSMDTKKKVPALKWGCSRNLNVGALTAAIGASVNKAFTAIRGAVSCVDCVIPNLDARHITHLIQTDAPIHPGNSGGPLLNGAGEVVGINTMCCPMNGRRSGMNLAIPSDLGHTVVDQLAKGGAVALGFIGIQIGDDLSTHFPAHCGGTNPGGVAIDSVFLGSPAQRSGIQEADVILAINGIPVSNHHQARTLIDTARPGHRVNIKCWRREKKGSGHQEGREMVFIVKAVPFPENNWPERSRKMLLPIP